MSELWAITCFFNPAGYRRRVQNYRWFREKLNVPLITVELSFNGHFSLGPADADILVQLTQGDIMFQKERLLNIALKRLPPGCTAVAWLDCDVVFASDDWADQTLKTLQRVALLQLFSERYDLPPDAGPEAIPDWKSPPDRPSLMAMLASEGLRAAEFQQAHFPRCSSWGLAWAARRDLLEEHGLYDACVLTNGDGAIFSAGFGLEESPFMRWRMNDASLRHYLEWAKPFSASVRGNMGYLEGRLFHFWHGGLAERRYGKCLLELQDLGFDPVTDIAWTEERTWRWASDKPLLHAHVREYFWSRNEDALSVDPEESSPSALPDTIGAKEESHGV
jgi:hypothetical protein